MEQDIVSSSGTEDVSVDKHGSKLTNALKFHHENNINDFCNVGEQENIYVDEEDDHEDADEDDDDDLTTEILVQSGYGKIEPSKQCKTGDQEWPHEDEEEEELKMGQSGYADSEPTRHSPMTWPSEKKLVSAFKGSCEEEGMLRRKKCVTWSPDVYDPPPSADDHFPQNKTEKHRGENKKQKSKQKRGGKSAGEGKRNGKGKGKDKKHTQKYDGSS